MIKRELRRVLVGWRERWRPRELTNALLGIGACWMRVPGG